MTNFYAIWCSRNLTDRPMTPDEFKTWREQTGYTQARAAERFFHVTRATVQNWEAGITPIPAAVGAACQVWGRRVRQEDAMTGPVTLVFSDGPMFRSPYGPMQKLPMMHSEQYATNAQALELAKEYSKSNGFFNPFIVEKGGETLWNSVELARVIEGKDDEAPTRENLLKRYASAIRALAANARENIQLTVWTDPPLPSEESKKNRSILIEKIALELEYLADSATLESMNYKIIEDRVASLRKHGKTPHSSFVSDAAQALVEIEANFLS